MPHCYPRESRAGLRNFVPAAGVLMSGREGLTLTVWGTSCGRCRRLSGWLVTSGSGGFASAVESVERLNRRVMVVDCDPMLRPGRISSSPGSIRICSFRAWCLYCQHPEAANQTASAAVTRELRTAAVQLSGFPVLYNGKGRESGNTAPPRSAPAIIPRHALLCGRHGSVPGRFSEQPRFRNMLGNRNMPAMRNSQQGHQLEGCREVGH